LFMSDVDSFLADTIILLSLTEECCTLQYLKAVL